MAKLTLIPVAMMGAVVVPITCDYDQLLTAHNEIEETYSVEHGSFEIVKKLGREGVDRM
jgi:hypothetical protein